MPRHVPSFIIGQSLLNSNPPCDRLSHVAKSFILNLIHHYERMRVRYSNPRHPLALIYLVCIGILLAAESCLLKRCIRSAHHCQYHREDNSRSGVNRFQRYLFYFKKCKYLKHLSQYSKLANLTNIEKISSYRV
jgi:hypothetical protein